MLDNTQLKTIIYALTLKAVECPSAVDDVVALCGQIPERGPQMSEQFNRCGHAPLFALWRQLVDENPDVATFAEAEWTLYQERLAQPPASMPPLTQQAFSAAGALCAEAKAILKSEAPVAPEEASRRMNLCEQCEFFKADEARCTQCGCYMRVKTRFRTAKCPRGKWGYPEK